MKKLFLYPLFFWLIASSSLNAQLNIKIEIRPRTEFRAGYRIPMNLNVSPSLFVSQRSRLSFDYTHEKLTIKTSIQDVRVWGDEIQNIDNPSIGLHEAYAQIQIGKNSFLIAGRQELVYDDHRLLGNSDWTQTARSHDALLYKFTNQKWKIDAIAAYNQLSENNFATEYTTSNYQTLLIGRIEHDNNQIALSFIDIADAYQINDTSLNQIGEILPAHR
ncbi:MAG: alginate export family protein [Chitinophagales bacterium]